MDSKKKRKGKVGPTDMDGHNNSSFELDLHSDTTPQNNSKLINTFRDVVNDTNRKKNALIAIAGAKHFGSRWKNYVTTKRAVKVKNFENSLAPPSSPRFAFAIDNEDNEKAAIKGMGLDNVDQPIENSFKPFGKQDTKKRLRHANDKILIDYFCQLGESRSTDAKVDLDFVDTLIKGGANINCTDKHGQSLLHEVSRTWHVDVAKFLFELGADVNLPDKYGRTPLHVAAAVDYAEMVDLLIKNGANKEARSNEEQTPVHYAAKNDACDSLKALIKNKCDYKTCKDYKGRTPLYVAAELDRSETASLLLSLDANVRTSDDIGMKPLSWMIMKMPPVAYDALKQYHTTDRPNRKQYYYLMDLVQDRGKDPNSRAPTPLFVATNHRQFDILTHKVMVALIDRMWLKFARWRAWLTLFLNFAYIMIWTVFGMVTEYDQRYNYVLPEQWWRIVLLIAALGFTAWQIVEEVIEYKRSVKIHNNWVNERKKQILQDLDFCHPRWTEESDYLKKEMDHLEDTQPRYWRDLWNVFDWICYFFLMACIITHIVDIFVHSETLARAHIRIMSVTLIILWLRLMKIARAFSLLGPFIVMLAHMIKDVVRFIFLYCVFYLPFVCAFFMIFGGDKKSDADSSVSVTVNGYENLGNVFYSLFRLTVVDDYDFDNMLLIDPIMAKILVGFWLALSAILCLNLFIALLSDTFQRVYDNAQANAVMQKAIMTLSLWEGMTSSSRNKFLNEMEAMCNPLSDYYDDDMTEDGEEDMKKVTLQIKDDLDDFRDLFSYKFGSRREDSDDEDNEKVVSLEKFDNEISMLKEGITQLKVRHDDMTEWMKTSIGNINNLLLELLGRPPDGGFPDISDTQNGSGTDRVKKLKKRKKTRITNLLEEQPLLETLEQSEEAPPPPYQPSAPTVDVSMADFSPADATQFSRPTDIPQAAFSPQQQDGHDPSTEC